MMRRVESGALGSVTADVCAIACELFGSVGAGGAQLLFAMFGFASGCPPLAPYAGLLGATLYGFGLY